MNRVLNNLSNLKLRCYRFNELKGSFYKEHQCASGNDESHDLVQIATLLDNENIAYRVDKDYNIKLYFDDSQDVFVVKLDSAGNILHFNAYATLITGYSSESVIGASWFEIFIDKEDISTIMKVFQGVLDSNMYYWNYVNKIRCKDGSTKEFKWKNSLVKDEIGGVDIVLAIGIIN